MDRYPIHTKPIRPGGWNLEAVLGCANEGEGERGTEQERSWCMVLVFPTGALESALLRVLMAGVAARLGH